MKSKSGGINFHQHSDYSFLDGAATVEQICSRAKEFGFKYVCCSDHGNVASHIVFYDEAIKQGLKPLLGTELYTVDDKYSNDKKKGYHLCVWALNTEGLHNVWNISSNTYYGTGNGHRTPNAKWGHFEGLGKGVACTSACLAGALSQAALKDDEEMALYFANKYSEIFDEFYIEIHTNSMPEQRKVNLWLVNFAKKHGFKMVYAVDAHYALEEDAEFHDIWLGCQIKAFYNENHWKMDHEYYMQGEDEISKRLDYLGDDLSLVFDGIDDFVSHIEDVEIDSSHKVPHFTLPDGWDDEGKYLKYLIAKGLLTKVAGCEVVENDPDEPVNLIKFKGDPKVDIRPYVKQLTEEEMPIIIDNGLSAYFLIVSDYCKYIKKNFLMSPGRGSCTASIVCYLLDITEVDPLGKGLFFSRFLNEGRLGSLPDIDSDFPAEAKKEVARYFTDKYGEDHVTAVGVTTFFGLKLALKEICRYYRIPINDSNKITSIAEELELLADGDSWEDHIDELPEDKKNLLLGYKQSFPDIFEKANKMVGLARQAGKHAAGYVISPDPVAGILPIRKSSDDEIISQFDKVAVERMGFLKADILGLRNLDTLMLAQKLVKERHGIDIDYYKLYDDPEDNLVWDIFETGNTLGVFQMESDGITRVATSLKPRSIMDLAVILALYRPGVINAKNENGMSMLEEYLNKAAGFKETTYITPELEPILKDTYGTVVYQEQAMQIFTDLAGYSPEGADHLRAAIGKKKLDKIKAEKENFISGCENNGIKRDAAELIFSQIEASGSYSFNKSHSYGYGTVTFWTAYMKAHYPIEYYTACMSTVGNDKAPLYMMEAKRRGFKIVPPKLSSISRGYTIISDDEISFGLVNVKGVGDKAIKKMLDAAPYKDFEDFVDRSGANSSVIKTLIKGGLFREIHENRRELLSIYEAGAFRSNLFGKSLTKEALLGIEASPYSDETISELETEIYGMPLSVDPFEPYRVSMGETYKYAVTYEEAKKSSPDAPNILLAKIHGIRTHMSKKGMMAFITFISDKDEKFDATCFSTTYDVIKHNLVEGNYLVIEIAKNIWQGKTSMILKRALPVYKGD